MATAQLPVPIKIDTEEIISWLKENDVVEVVRCKDCKHFKQNIFCVGGEYDGCDAWDNNGNEIEVKPEDFCSYGERKDG